MNEVNWLVGDVIVYGLKALVSARDVTHRYFKYDLVTSEHIHEYQLNMLNMAVEKCASSR